MERTPKTGSFPAGSGGSPPTDTNNLRLLRRLEAHLFEQHVEPW
ncbi:MAG: hypothetical protein M0013_12570 [Actinomycetota bacterium]|nr:hypothetical protein [Actinomycetota bacterium]